MAKVKSIDEIVDRIVANYEVALTDAVKDVAKDAEKYIYSKAVDILYEFYYGKYDPNRYERTYSLSRSFVPFHSVKKTGTALRCVAGVEYDPSLLDSYYEASNKYGYADGDWVIENFLEGLHPWDRKVLKATGEYKLTRGRAGRDENQTVQMRKVLNYYTHSIFARDVITQMIINMKGR